MEMSLEENYEKIDDLIAASEVIVNIGNYTGGRLTHCLIL
jgi:polysaccharide deacetylase 2 family uncharacterized protein YibQ